ncbi:hypothetical protein MTO96_049299 [Rhipicephalus appendiculatus]
MDYYEEESTVKFFLFMTLVVSAVVFVLLGLMLFGFEHQQHRLQQLSNGTAQVDAAFCGLIDLIDAELPFMRLQTPRVAIMLFHNATSKF